MWIWDGAKENFDFIEIFLFLVKGLIQPPKSTNPTEGNKEQLEEKFRSSLLLSVVILRIVVVAQAQNARITITSAEERKNKPHYLINGEVPLVNEYLSSFSPFSPIYCICCKTIMFPNNVLNSYICFLNKILKVFKENSHSSSLLSWILSTTFSNLTTSITLSFAIQLQTAVPNTN